jgi:hypothetical protein
MSTFDLQRLRAEVSNALSRVHRCEALLADFLSRSLGTSPSVVSSLLKAAVVWLILTTLWIQLRKVSRAIRQSFLLGVAIVNIPLDSNRIVREETPYVYAFLMCLFACQPDS